MFRNTLKKLCKKFLDESDFADMLVETCDVRHLSKEEEALMFADLKKVENFQQYLTNMMGNDKDRYFIAGSPMEQLQVKGAFSRTTYLRSRLREEKDVKLESPRHA